jgi:pSer/pThr/pTyr-binding forkhead associated (FHA) protein
MPARLTLHFPTAPARELILPDSGEILVGRSAGCGVVVADDRVSRRHALLTAGPAGWTIADLGSKNGTLVDGRLVMAGRLPAQSWLSFGGLIAHFEAVESSVAELEEHRRRRLTTMTEARQALVDPRAGLSELLSRVVSSMLSLTNAERGFLLLAGEAGELQVAARSGLSWDDLRAAEFGGSAGAVERALASGQPVVSLDAGADAELGARASIAAGGIRALLCVPIREAERAIGAMYADSRKPGAAFTELDLEILEGLAAQAGLALAVSRLNGELRGLAERIAHEAGSAASWQSLRAAHPPGAAS